MNTSVKLPEQTINLDAEKAKTFWGKGFSVNNTSEQCVTFGSIPIPNHGLERIISAEPILQVQRGHNALCDYQKYFPVLTVFEECPAQYSRDVTDGENTLL